MERYYERRAIKLGSVRHCKKCKTKLSRYNYEEICSVCSDSEVYDERKKLLDMINGTNRPS